MELKEIAVTNRPIEAGEKIELKDLEKSDVVSQLKKSGLLKDSDDVLNKEKVKGAFAKNYIDTWNTITDAMIYRTNDSEGSEISKEEKREQNEEIDLEQEVDKKVIHIEIEEIKGLKIDLPLEVLAMFKNNPEQANKGDDIDDNEIEAEDAPLSNQKVIILPETKKSNHRKWLAKNR